MQTSIITLRQWQWIGLTMFLLASLTLFVPVAQAATITVNTTDDEDNMDGDCSLREAIIAANTDAEVDDCNAGNGADIIGLPAGDYVLTIAGTSEDAAATGDLDIVDDLTLMGAGAANTTINANGLDRVLEIENSAQVSIARVTIRGGDSGFQAGGGIRVGSGFLTLTGSRVRNNSGFSAIYVLPSGVLTLTNSGIANNNVQGIKVAGGTVTVINSMISDNMTTKSGGAGIAVDSTGTLTVTNSTISGNTTDFSGGGIHSDGTTNLYNVTITNNTANTDGLTSHAGGGISTFTGTVTIRNSIIAGNINPKPNPVPDCSGTLTSQGYNLIEDTAGCTIVGDTTGNITGASPNLGPLQNNGGQTFTHALLAGSPAIDAGNPAGCLDQNGLSLEVDQRGFIRPVDGHGDTLDVCDIGAYEYDSPGPASPEGYVVYLPLVQK